MKPDYILLKKCGYSFEEEEQKLYDRMVEIVDYLCLYNKNYTKKQFYEICELKDIIKCMEV